MCAFACSKKTSMSSRLREKTMDDMENADAETERRDCSDAGWYGSGMYLKMEVKKGLMWETSSARAGTASTEARKACAYRTAAALSVATPCLSGALRQKQKSGCCEASMQVTDKWQRNEVGHENTPCHAQAQTTRPPPRTSASSHALLSSLSTHTLRPPRPR
ncbi:hypothetical protein BC830DRAFT_159560 [Chytriomyces sp. MP71]|nr:hypothetical protein BC830DRAFT_159560 [Chytriomyces sp. MP71]